MWFKNLTNTVFLLINFNIRTQIQFFQEFCSTFFLELAKIGKNFRLDNLYYKPKSQNNSFMHKTFKNSHKNPFHPYTFFKKPLIQNQTFSLFKSLHQSIRSPNYTYSTHACSSFLFFISLVTVCKLQMVSAEKKPLKASIEDATQRSILESKKSPAKNELSKDALVPRVTSKSPVWCQTKTRRL